MNCAPQTTARMAPACTGRANDIRDLRASESASGGQTDRSGKTNRGVPVSSAVRGRRDRPQRSIPTRGRGRSNRPGARGPPSRPGRGRRPGACRARRGGRPRGPRPRCGSAPGGLGHVAVGDRHVPSGARRVDGRAHLGRRVVERGLGLHGHMAVARPVVAVADEALAGLGTDRLDPLHRKPRRRRDVDRRHDRWDRLAHLPGCAHRPHGSVARIGCRPSRNCRRPRRCHRRVTGWNRSHAATATVDRVPWWWSEGRTSTSRPPALVRRCRRPATPAPRSSLPAGWAATSRRTWPASAPRCTWWRPSAPTCSATSSWPRRRSPASGWIGCAGTRRPPARMLQSSTPAAPWWWRSPTWRRPTGSSPRTWTRPET